MTIKEEVKNEYDDMLGKLPKNHALVALTGSLAVTGFATFLASASGVNPAFAALGVGALATPIATYIGYKIGEFRANKELATNKDLTPEQLEAKKLEVIGAVKNFNDRFFGGKGNESELAVKNVFTETPKRDVFNVFG